MDIVLTLIGIAVAFVAVVYIYERELDRIHLKTNEWRDKYWKSLHSNVETAYELGEVRCVLRRCQGLLEDDHDEIDKLRSERVVSESCGAGGQC